MPLPSPARLYVLALYRRGVLASLEEGALVASVSRVTVRAWLIAAGIDWTRERERFLARHRSGALAQSEGRKLKRRTKAEMRELGARAVKAWTRRQRSRRAPLA